jgi:hypothetical protein
MKSPASLSRASRDAAQPWAAMRASATGKTVRLGCFRLARDRLSCRP